MTDVLRYGLPKWPGMVVTGDRVTPDRAMEIIVRTDSLNFCLNDHAFERHLNEALGVGKHSRHSDTWDWDKLEEVRASLGCLDGLEYLRNSRIGSSWIGGPHGWCDWDGTIGCNNYNIGKWPTCEDVFGEWEAIARAFPFLCLRCQLFDGETCEEGIRPVVEYSVGGGTVDAIEPTDTLTPVPNDTAAEVRELLFNPHRERGCAIEQFRRAVEHVRIKVSTTREETP